MPATSSESCKQSLRHDEDGAILILGVVMGALLVAALWNIASVGDAAVWREHLQDGADASAFENAVWNARGMNVLVLLNILMSMVMAVLVVWRAIEIFLGVLLALIAISCIVTIFFPNPLTGAVCELGLNAAQPIANALARMASRDPKLAENVFKIIDKLIKAQKIVASAVPLLGVAESSASSSAAYGMPALGLSASLIPSIQTKTDDIQDRVGTPVSLPVQEESEWKLCAMAGEFVPNQLAGVLERIAGGCGSGGGGLCSVVSAIDSGPIKGLAGGIAGSLPTIFCGAGGIPPIADQVIKDAADEACNNASKSDPDNKDEKYVEVFGKYWNKGKKFDADACKKDQLKKINGEQYGNKGKHPLKVWDYANNGNFFMQSWGISSWAPQNLERDDRALDVGDGAAAGNLSAAPDSSLGSAEAEIYWDCAEGWVPGCKSKAMWQMRWRARLRRYHRPDVMLLRATKDVAVATLAEGLDKRVGNLTKKLGAKFNLPAFVTGNLWSTYWSSKYAKNGLFYPTANKTVGAWIDANVPRDEASTVLH